MVRKRRTELPGTSQSESGDIGGVQHPSTQQLQQPQQPQGRYEGAGRGAPQRGGYAGQSAVAREIAVGSGGVQHPPAQPPQLPQQHVRPQQQGGRGMAPQPREIGGGSRGLQPQQQGGRGMAPQRGGYGGRGGPGGRMPTHQYGGAPGYQQGRGGLQYQQGGPLPPQRPDGAYGGGRGISPAGGPSGQALNPYQTQVGSQPSPYSGKVDAGPSSSAQPTEPSVPDVIEQTQQLSVSTEVVQSQVMQPASSKSVRFPARPGFGSRGRRCLIRANHFLVKLQDKDIHHYDVSITPEVPSRGVNRAVMEQLVKLYQESHLGKRLPAYDGRKGLYTAGPLPFETKDFDINLGDEGGAGGSRRERLFKVQIKFAARTDLHQLQMFLEGKRPDGPQDAIQVLDIVLRQLPTLKCVPFGRSFYSDHLFDKTTPLGDGLVSWSGYYQSVRPTQSGLSLNIDKSATAFFKPVPVIDFVSELLRGIPARLTPNDNLKIKRALKGVRVEVTHRGNMRRKYRITGLTSEPIRDLTFPVDDLGTTKYVIDYFREKYGVVIQHYQLPCLLVGNPQKLTYLPMEVCKIVDGQRYPKKLNEVQTSALLQVTCQRPEVREENIIKIVKGNAYGDDKYAKEFGIQIDTKPVTFAARVLQPPKLTYNPSGRDRDCIPQVGQWNMMHKKMYQGGRVDNWTCINFAQNVRGDTVWNFCQQLADMCNTSGVPFNLEPVLPFVTSRPDSVKQTLERLRGKELDLLIAILPDHNNGQLYGNFKRICETELGIASQCCLAKNAYKMSKQYLANVSLKINVKVGGANNVLSDALARRIPIVSAKPTIIFGADVTHPNPGEDSSPSIAAVVASQDVYMTRYAARISAQTHREEIIQDLGAMVRELLISFKDSTRGLSPGGLSPAKIIFYRDGVSEGQFSKVLQSELDAIRKACTGVNPNYRPDITFVVVQKRHHTRLFAEDHRDTDKSGNVLAGTVVDSKICHPSEFDFYLCSHPGLKGTSRPAHYHVLWDDNKFTADDLQSFTNDLCYTFARCTRAVSIPPPAYYAHLAAFRARFYMGPGESDTASTGRGGAGAGGSTRTNVAVRPLPQVVGNVKNSMFFC